jgi:outer membrane lipoprotein-sorting protein
MRKSGFLLTCVGVVALAAAASAWAQPAGGGILGRHKDAVKLTLHEILARMDDAGRHLKTLTADLTYTKVTVLVNDRSTEKGTLYFHNGRNPQIRIDFTSPDTKTVLFRKNKGEIYLPRIKQIQVYDLSHHEGLVQQFLLLGFGSDTNELKKAYNIRFVKEERIGGNKTALLELIPRNRGVAAQISKIDLWINEETWFPVQQRFLEPSGDYMTAQYSDVGVDRRIPSSEFQLKVKGAKRVRMD